MDPLVPLADDPLPPPSPSYTHSSASSTSRSHRRPADLHSLSSRESDWSSSSDAEHISEEDEGDDDAFDLVSSAELPPPVASAPAAPPAADVASIRSLGTATSSNDSASESADDSDSPSHMKLSFPDPLNASSSSAASDGGQAHSERDRGGEQPGRTANLDESILLDGEGAYSLLLDARTAPASSSAADEAAEPDSGSGLTSPRLRAQDEPPIGVDSGDEDEQRVRAVEGGVGEWVRRTRLSAKKREQGMRERGVQTVRSVEGDGDDVKLELESSVLSSMAGSSLVSSQATVVPAAAQVAVAAPELVEPPEQRPLASEPLSPVVEDATAAVQRQVRRDASHALFQRRRTLLAVALATTLALSASIWLGPSSAGPGVVVGTRACERDGPRAGAQAVRPDVGQSHPSTADAPTAAAWLETVLGDVVSPSPSAGAAAVEPAAASPSSPPSPRRKLFPVAEPVSPSSPAKPEPSTAAAPVHVHSSTRPCAACALATLSAAPRRAVVPFAPAVRAPTATAVAHGNRCGHPRPRRARVELGTGPGVEQQGGAEEETERVSLFREPAAVADSPVDAPEAQQLPPQARRLQDRVHDLVVERLARAQRVVPPASHAHGVADRAGRLARSTGALVTQSTHAGFAAVVERARRLSRRAHVRKSVRALGSSSGARTRREVERLVRSVRRAPELTHDVVGHIKAQSRRAGRVTEAGRRAMVEAALTAQLPHRARRALRRLEASTPSRRQLKEAASSRLPRLDLRADLDLVVARIRSYASSRLARASVGRAAVDVVSKRCTGAVQEGAEESRRHVRRAARTARRLAKKVERRVGRRERRA
ncbi:hypothetical protein JCM3775_000714 [Rhodotorula graminis]